MRKLWESWIVQSAYRQPTGLNGQEPGVRVPVGENLPPLHVIDINTGTHTASCPVGFSSSFLGNKTAGL
jgi:hypothetical protein